MLIIQLDSPSPSDEGNPHLWLRTILGRMRHVLAYMRAALPNTHIVVLGILPRGGWTLPGSGYQWPNRMTSAIQLMNNNSQVMAMWLQPWVPVGEFSVSMKISCIPAILHMSWLRSAL